jgi:glycosyltransferase involved in cell wall biosynthesis
MLVICPYPEGKAAGQRLKYEQYFDDWRRLGYRIDVSPFLDEAGWDKAYVRGHHLAKALGVIKGYSRRARDLFRIRKYDLLYVHMWVTPFGPSLFERLTRSLAARLVFDLEDNVFIGHGSAAQEHPNPLLRFLKGPGKARYLVRTADHVVTSSPFLNESCKSINARRACTYISSSVDTDRFEPANRTPGIVTIGWTGTFSSRVYLDMLRPVFQTLAARVPFRLKVIGNFDYELPGVDLEVIRWTAENEVSDLQTFDIGVYPLPLDDWVLGKSGLKAIQYMAFGIPCVATDVGTTPMLIRSGENGILVKSEAEWVDALERLIRNPDERRRLGDAARRDAVAKYSIRAIAEQYQSVLASAAGNPNG